jgi:hypothetical protein
MAGIPHHLLDLLPPSEMFNAGDWVDAAWEVTADIIKVRPSTAHQVMAIDAGPLASTRTVALHRTRATAVIGVRHSPGESSVWRRVKLSEAECCGRDGGRTHTSATRCPS